MPNIEDKTEASDNQSTFDLDEDDGLSDVNVLIPSSNNKRIATRYVRDDIAVALCETTAISFGKEIFIDFVTLNDITGRGISFSSMQYITLRKRVILNLRFHSNTTFKIHATIVYRSNTAPYQYGIKFDSDNRELSDHLLDTQRNLVFK
ncbi:MAG: hypothetical protein LUO95_04650 [Methylococcaceae bacterium]|nr:hypothetical protein [Methylococcaceae bacterium]MDD1609898.1 hypothetical protein [Methylococcaceae bacterium]MDD1616271.1 hypothetical protein [Methylococcaceae bacterium]